MNAKFKFDVFRVITQILTGFTMVFSFIMWNLEALSSVNSFEYEFWWIMLLTSTIILFMSWGIFKFLENKYFPSESKEQHRKIPKYKKWSKICSFTLTSGLIICVIPLVALAYTVGIVSILDLHTHYVSNFIVLLSIIIAVGLIMEFGAYIMILAGAWKDIEDDENSE